MYVVALDGQYAVAVKAVRSLDRKAGGLFAALGAYAIALGGVDALTMKQRFLQQEKAATVQEKVDMGKNSTYRVVKNLFINCRTKGVSLVGDDDKLKGKTELEDELDALKEEKTPLEKFKAQMVAATNISKHLTGHDRLVAAGLASDLVKELSKGIALAA